MALTGLGGASRGGNGNGHRVSDVEIIAGRRKPPVTVTYKLFDR